MTPNLKKFIDLAKERECIEFRDQWLCDGRLAIKIPFNEGIFAEPFKDCGWDLAVPVEFLDKFNGLSPVSAISKEYDNPDRYAAPVVAIKAENGHWAWFNSLFVNTLKEVHSDAQLHLGKFFPDKADWPDALAILSGQEIMGFAMPLHFDPRWSDPKWAEFPEDEPKLIPIGVGGRAGEEGES